MNSEKGVIIMAETLTEFLLLNPVDNLTKEIIVSERLKSYPFTVRALDNEAFTECQKASTTTGRHSKVNFDTKKFNDLIILKSVIEPNFKDAELLKKAGSTTATDFINRSLLSGEIAELSQQILHFSGFDQSTEELKDEVKNF